MANVDNFQGLQSQISNSMNLINSSYYNSSLISPFLGNAQLIGSPPFVNTFPPRITQADSSTVPCPSNSQYLNLMFTQITLAAANPFGTPVTSAPIYTFQLNGSTYNNSTIASFANPSAQRATNRDINCMACYIGSPTPPNTSTNVFQFMQALYAWYGILDGNNWKAFCNGQSIAFKIPDSTGTGLVNLAITGFSISQDVMVNSGTATANVSIQNLLKTIMDYNLLIGLNTFQFNPFPAKRTIYAYIQLMQFQLAMGIYKSVMGGTNAQLQQGANGLLQSIAYILDNSNAAIISANGGVNNILMQNTRSRIQNYNTFVTNITSLDSTVSTGKNKLSTQQQKVAAQMDTTALVRRFELSAFIILIVILSGSAVTVIAPLESTTKVASASLLVILSIVAAFIMNFVYRSKNISLIESFDSSPYANDIPLLNVGINASDYTGISTVMYVYYLNGLNNYFTNTLNLSNSLQTYRTYADMNTALQKEQQYYTDTNNQIVNATGKVRSVYKLSFLDQIRKTALMNFFMTMAIVTSATIAGYISAKEYAPSVSSIVLIIGVSLIVALFIIFLIEVNSRVRTNGEKIYWGSINSKYENSL